MRRDGSFLLHSSGEIATTAHFQSLQQGAILPLSLTTVIPISEHRPFICADACLEQIRLRTSPTIGNPCTDKVDGKIFPVQVLPRLGHGQLHGYVGQSHIRNQVFCTVVNPYLSVARTFPGAAVRICQP